MTLKILVLFKKVINQFGYLFFVTIREKNEKEKLKQKNTRVIIFFSFYF